MSHGPSDKIKNGQLSKIHSGGPAGMIYMYIFAWLGAWCTFASLCELASM